MKKLVILFTGIMFLFSLGMAQDFSISKSFPGITNVKVEADFLDVQVVGGGASSVNIRGEIDGDADDYQIRYNINGKTLKVWVESPRFSFRSVDGFIKLEIPDKGDYNIQTSSGKMEVRDLNASDMKFSTTSGSMQAANLSGSGQLISTSGSIRFSDSNGDFQVSSTSGGIRTNGFRGSLTASSTSGSSYFNGVDGRLKATSSSGSINLEQVNAQLNLQSSSGSIKGEMVRIDDDCRLNTSSGGIRLDLVNDLDQLSFNCSASSGRIKVGNLAQGQNVVLNNGGPKITAISSSGGQQYY
jgi:DUF4097 and DUF4098 domain-containing protein YvlB